MASMKLRRQRSPPPMTFEAFGVAVQVALGDAALQGRVESVLPPSRVACDASMAAAHFRLQASEPEGYTVTVDEASWVERADLDVAIGVLDAQLRMFVATNAKDVIFVHAGAIARDGRALLLPGPSFAGKTTLVAALVQAGATYYSDEYAVLDEEGRVHPYARRLSIRNGTPAMQELSVDELGGVAADRCAEVSVVAITRYRAGVEWEPKLLTAGEGVVALLANTVPAQERPRESLHALSRAVQGATVLEGDRGEAQAVVPQLLDQLASSGSSHDLA
jgi:hypothetical protein